VKFTSELRDLQHDSMRTAEVVSYDGRYVVKH